MSFIKINNQKIHYKVKGNGQTILFIHGLGSSTKDWEAQVNYFSKEYKTICIDLRGHGLSSSVNGKYSIAKFTTDVLNVIKNEFDAFIIVGISMGGMIALNLAINYPDKIEKLIFINSFIELDLNNKEVKKGIRIRKLIPRFIGMRMMGKVLGKKVFPYKHQKGLRTVFAKRWSKNSTKDYIKTVDAITNWSVKSELHKLKCKTLLISSEFDYKPLTKEDAKLFPNSKLVVIPNSHHAVTIEKPNEVNKVIQAFL